MTGLLRSAGRRAVYRCDQESCDPGSAGLPREICPQCQVPRPEGHATSYSIIARKQSEMQVA